ncbi:unnamed protein product [Rhodiola kirilowii]
MTDCKPGSTPMDTKHLLSLSKADLLTEPMIYRRLAAHRVLRYIKSAPAQGLLFLAGSALDIIAFCDADWGACPVTRKSITVCRI